MRIYFTSLHDEKFNGGKKAQNLWVNYLNSIGIESYYIPDYDGSVVPWLVNHCASTTITSMLSDFDRMDDLLVTTWLDNRVASLILDNQLPFVYMDLEWHWTQHYYSNVKSLLSSGLLRKYITHSHHIKTLAKKEFGVEAKVVNEWSDPSVFYYDATQKQSNLIGFSDEGQNDIISKLASHDFMKDHFTFIQLIGDEDTFASQMRRCEYFLGTNPGKYMDTVLGMLAEGCPRTPQEALHCGCIVVAKDVVGNREYIVDNKTGFFVDFNNIESVVDFFRALNEDPSIKNEIIKNASTLIYDRFSPNHNKEIQIREAFE